MRSGKGFLILVGLVVLSNIAILLDVPGLRPVLALLTFSFLPGLAALYALRLERLGFLTLLLLSVGTSLALLMFFGLLINQVYPFLGIERPLSTLSLLPSFSLLTLLLGFIAYLRNREGFILPAIGLKVAKRGLILSPLIFSFLFPLLSVWGTHLMKNYGTNSVLLAMLFLLPLFAIFLLLFRKHLPEATYPLSLWNMALALLFMTGLISNYLIGRDVHSEYYASRVVEDNLRWDMNAFYNVLTATLSTSLLPTVYGQLAGVDTLFVYKVIYSLITALMPVSIYALCRRFMDVPYAFLAGLFFVAQRPFLFTLQSAMRQEIALFFFTLAVLLLIGERTDNMAKKGLFLTFMVATVLTHYTTSYIFFFLLLGLWISKGLLSALRAPVISGATGTALSLLFVTIFMWYAQLTETGFTGFVQYLENAFRMLGKIFVLEARETQQLQILGIGGEKGLPQTIYLVAHWVTFGFIAIGALNSIKERVIDKEKAIGFDLLSLMLLAGAVNAFWLAVPRLGYSGDRIYIQSLVLLAPAFVLGGRAITRYTKTGRFLLPLLVTVLILQFFSASFLVDYLSGGSEGWNLTKETLAYGERFIYDEEVVAAKWLEEHNEKFVRVATDYPGFYRLLYGYKGRPWTDTSYFYNWERSGVEDMVDYVYLRRANIVSGRVYPTDYYIDIQETSYYAPILEDKDTVYSSGGVRILR